MTISANPSPPYVFQEYPKWKFHPDKRSQVVADYEAEKALGADWYDSPDEAAQAFEKLKQTVKSK